MINIKKFSKSALILLPFLSIGWFPKEVNAANLTMGEYRIWCEDTKGGKVVNVALAAGVTKKCQVDGKDIKNSGVPFSLITGIAKDYCLCDSNGSGVADKGDELKDPHGMVIPPKPKKGWFDWFFDLFSSVDPIDPPVLASLEEGANNLYTSLEFPIWVALTLNNSGNLEMAVDLREVPTLDQDPVFAEEGFTEMNLIYRDEMGSLSGITLASLTQGEKNFVEFSPTLFEPFGEFSAWQLGVTVYNPITEQQGLLFEDKIVPEPSTIIGLLAVGGLGIASKLRKKSQ